MLDPDYLRALDMGEARTVIAGRDAMLYALSIGLGADPIDPFDLCYTYERDLAVFPTMALVVMGAPHWLDDPRTGISWNHVVHGAEHLVVHRELPLDRPITARLHVAEIFDRDDKGALLVLERRLSDADGAPLATIRQQVLCRADGGFGGQRGSVARRPVPERAPDPRLLAALAAGPASRICAALRSRSRPKEKSPKPVRPRISNSADVLIMIGFVLPRSPATCRSIRAERSAAPSSGRRPSVERICLLMADDVLRRDRASATGPEGGSFACCSRRITSPSRTGRSIQPESPLSDSNGGGSKGSRA
jgi:hypothetical protein